MEIFVRQEWARVERNTGLITISSGLSVEMMDALDGTYVWDHSKDAKFPRDYKYCTRDQNTEQDNLL
jgi:hypothetical protein